MLWPFTQIAAITRQRKSPVTTLPHDQHVATLVLDGKEDLRNHDENPPLVRWVDCPHAVHIGWVIPRVVGGLNVARVLPQLASTNLIWGTDNIAGTPVLGGWPGANGASGKTWTLLLLSGYFCNVTRWWRHRSQWWCSPGRWCSSSGQTRTGRFQQGSGCSDECWSCSNVQERSALEEVTGQC